MARRSGLGRGLDALIPQTEEHIETSGSALRDIPVGDIRANTYQPRHHFDPDALESLTASVRESGVLQPILVRELTDGGYELIAGERRWRAAKLAGLDTVPAIVRSVDDMRSLEEALVENLHREDLGALEEAAAYQQLLREFGLTQEQVAVRVGKSRSSVANTVRLLQLPSSVQHHMSEGRISAGHARALLSLLDDPRLESLADEVAAGGLSVRGLEDRVKKIVADDQVDADRDGDSSGAGADEVGRTRDAAVLETERLLGDHLDTRVRVKISSSLKGSAKGRIMIDFASVDDLKRIYDVIVGGREAMD